MIQSNGKIVVAGVSNGSIALARYNTDGTLDTNFNSGGAVPGTVITTISSNDAAYGVGLQSDNNYIVIAGASNGSIVLARYINDGVSDGTLDATYGTAGIVTTDVGIVNEALSLAIQSDNKAVIAGFFDTQMLIGRYTTAGAVDTTFGSSGFATIQCGTQTVANAVAIQTNNNIVTAGFIDRRCVAHPREQLRGI